MDSFFQFKSKLVNTGSVDLLLSESIGNFPALNEYEKSIAKSNLIKVPHDNGTVLLKDIGWNVPSTYKLWAFDFVFEKVADKGKRVWIDPKTLIPTQSTCNLSVLERYIDNMRTDLPIIFSVEGDPKIYAHDHTRVSVQILAERHKIEALHFVCRNVDMPNERLIVVNHK